MERRKKNEYRSETRDSAKEFDQRVVELKRVSRVVAGGKRLRFRALVVIGDRVCRVGYGLAKGADVSQAVTKAVRRAGKNVFRVRIDKGTIPQLIRQKFSSASIFMKPAPRGSGVIAGGAMRPVLELAGVENVVAKMLGSSNKLNNVRATYFALKKISRRPVSAPQRPGATIVE